MLEGISWAYVVTLATTMGGYVLAFLLIPRVVLDRREAGATFAWVLIILFLPYLGALAFLFLGRNRIRRRSRRRLEIRADLKRSLQGLPTSPDCPLNPKLEELPEPGRDIARVAVGVSQSPLMPGNRTEVYIDADHAYQRMQEAIEGARRHVHLMSYIYRADKAGRRFRDLLVDKARQGVETRLLVDAIGGSEVTRRFLQPLLAAGGKFGRFMPVFGGRAHFRPNLRNHRKILVVDNELGFAGGMNIGDEYQGRKIKFAPWRDTHLRLQGPAVRRLQEVFSEDWRYTTGESLADAVHFSPVTACGPDLVQVVDSGPDHDHQTIHTVFFTALNEANHRVYITTPYFVPDQPILLALKAAAWRGVDVRLLVPGRSDMWLVQLAGRSFYQELLDTGVKIYELRQGILHAKTMVIDGVWSTIGSANMDMRSFRLNFEVNVLVFGAEFAHRMEEIFLRDLDNSRPITLESCRQRPRRARMAESLSRMLSPVL
ncbi:MAG TPA: cardiolipin synthase [Myxococcota bacterium]|nr:cardiolipin synthase [Myxococcota bacterium]